MGKRNKKKVGMPKRFKKVSNESNPFEVRVNRQHHSVLGRKKKEDRGLPGVSRSKALKKREVTILKEYQQLHKSNTFVDRRIGENGADVDPDEKAVARFAREWRKNRKGNLFNLNDEDLTHMGKSLGDISEFDNPRSDSEDEDANLRGDFVKKAHFGGFMTVKNANLVEPEKSHKEIIQELISDTKKKKYERQAEREANTDLTDKLDQDWKALQSLLAKTKPVGKFDRNETEDDYDYAVNSLKYEVRGKASNPLKTQERLMQEQKEKMQALEADRQKRMKGPHLVSAPKVHTSADSLDDGLLLNQDEEGDEASNEREIDSSNLHSNNQNESIHDDEHDCDDSSNDEGASDDSYADIISENEISESERDSKSKVQPRKKLVCSKKSDASLTEMPCSSGDLVNLFSNMACEEQAAVVEKIIECHDPGLGEGNRDKLEGFFKLLLGHIHDICKDSDTDLLIIDGLVPHFYKLLQLSPVAMSQTILGLIKEKREEFLEKSKGRAGKKAPTLETLVFLKLVPILYPTSDFHHPVVTCAMLFMSEILVNCPTTSISNILIGLFVSSLFLEYVSYAKRLVPEVIDFLTSLLPSAEPRSLKEKVYHKLLLLTNGVEVAEAISLKLLTQRAQVPSTSQTKYNILHSCVSLLCQFADLYSDVPSFEDIFAAVSSRCSHLDQTFFNSELKDKVAYLTEGMNRQRAKKQLSHQRKKPCSIKMYEPRFQSSFDGHKTRPTTSAKKAEQQKLQYKYKKELKGAVREIRRDNQFISQQQWKDQQEKDVQRKQKLKSLYHDLAQQEGEFKKYKKRRR